MVRGRRSRRLASFLLLGALVAAALASYGRATGESGGHGKMPVAKTASVALDSGTTYWWRVTDVDKNGGSTTSEIFSFRTGN
jgi:hypothetical protein